jgi:hypothetical protein
MASPIEKGLNVCVIASQIVEYSAESCPILLNSSQHFQCSTYLNFKLISGAADLHHSTFFMGIPLERDVGYCRMVKIETYLRIGGTAVLNTDEAVPAPGDVHKQTTFILDRFLLHLRDAGRCVFDPRLHGRRRPGIGPRRAD